MFSGQMSSACGAELSICWLILGSLYGRKTAPIRTNSLRSSLDPAVGYEFYSKVSIMEWIESTTESISDSSNRIGLSLAILSNMKPFMTSIKRVRIYYIQHGKRDNP